MLPPTVALALLTSSLLLCTHKVPLGPQAGDRIPPGMYGPSDDTDDRQVSQQQLQCVRDSFSTYFHGGSSATSHSTIGPAKVDVEWSGLKSAVDQVKVGEDTLRALRIHYGLAASSAPHDYQFTIGLEVLRIKRISGDDWTVIPVPDAFYTVDGNGALTPGDLATWGDDDTYFAHAYVRRASNITTFAQVDKDIDTRNFTLPWEDELLLLHDQNAGCDAIRFVCIAEPGERAGAIDKDMRHHLCAVALDGSSELVDNGAVEPSSPFTNKACDIGCPCPSLCNNAAFPQHGIAVKQCP